MAISRIRWRVGESPVVSRSRATQRGAEDVDKANPCELAPGQGEEPEAVRLAGSDAGSKGPPEPIRVRDAEPSLEEHSLQGHPPA